MADNRYSNVVIATSDPGATSLKLVVPGLTTLKGRVVLDGVPVRAFGLIVASRAWSITQSGQVFSRDTFWRQTSPKSVRSDDGRFLKQRVPAGKVTLVVAGDGFAQKVLDIDVPEGDVYDVGDIIVDLGQVVRGRVTDAAGEPVEGATVRAEQHAEINVGGGSPLLQRMLGRVVAVTDRDGVYELIGIPPPVKYGHEPSVRENTIEATHPILGATPTRKLPPEETRVDFVLDATGSIEGKVVGEKYGAAVVAMRLAQQDVVHAKLNSDGSFRFERLPVGEYELSVAGSDSNWFRPKPTRVVVVANQRMTATIIVPNGVTIVVRPQDGACETVTLKDPAQGSDSRAGLAQVRCIGAEAEIRGVPPAAYTACVDQTNCMPVLVTLLPTTQYVSIAKRR